MPNLYASLADIKATLGGITGTTRDAELLSLLEDISRAIDEETGRHFYSVIATRLYDGSGNDKLWLFDDLISVTTLKVDEDGDLVYEKTLTANTDYWLYPDNPLANTPYYRIDINPESSNISAFPSGRRRVQLVGKFGYSEETQSAGTLGAAILNATDTSVTMLAGHSVNAGDTIIVDSEQMYVSAVATNTLTVTRGVNGTTAAAHSNGAAVSKRRYPRPIERAVLLQVARFHQEGQTGFSGQLASPELGSHFSALYPAIRDLINPLRLLTLA
ncbi:MAG TPA: hypothetical protein VNL15_06120 [Dehalococcoidia bacterium]|nr:hypothetical protein [Dehalococcoidia bacterium]